MAFSFTASPALVLTGTRDLGVLAHASAPVWALAAVDGQGAGNYPHTLVFAGDASGGLQTATLLHAAEEAAAAPQTVDDATASPCPSATSASANTSVQAQGKLSAQSLPVVPAAVPALLATRLLLSPDASSPPRALCAAADGAWGCAVVAQASAGSLAWVSADGKVVHHSPTAAVAALLARAKHVTVLTAPYAADGSVLALAVVACGRDLVAATLPADGAGESRSSAIASEHAVPVAATAVHRSAPGRVLVASVDVKGGVAVAALAADCTATHVGRTDVPLGPAVPLSAAFIEAKPLKEASPDPAALTLAVGDSLGQLTLIPYDSAGLRSTTAPPACFDVNMRPIDPLQSKPALTRAWPAKLSIAAGAPALLETIPLPLQLQPELLFTAPAAHLPGAPPALLACCFQDQDLELRDLSHGATLALVPHAAAKKQAWMFLHAQRDGAPLSWALLTATAPLATTLNVTPAGAAGGAALTLYTPRCAAPAFLSAPHHAKLVTGLAALPAGGGMPAFASVSDDGQLRVTQAAAAPPHLRSSPALHVATDTAKCVCAAGQYLVVGGGNGKLTLLEAASPVASGPEVPRVLDTLTLEATGGAVPRVLSVAALPAPSSASPAGALVLACGTSTGELALLHCEGGKMRVLASSSAHAAPVLAVKLVRVTDELLLLSACSRGVLRLWQVGLGPAPHLRSLAALQTHAAGVAALDAISVDPKWVPVSPSTETTGEFEIDHGNNGLRWPRTTPLIPVSTSTGCKPSLGLAVYTGGDDGRVAVTLVGISAHEHVSVCSVSQAHYASAHTAAVKTVGVLTSTTASDYSVPSFYSLGSDQRLGTWAVCSDQKTITSTSMNYTTVSDPECSVVIGQETEDRPEIVIGGRGIEVINATLFHRRSNLKTASIS
jgi:hypothetical protein